MIYPILSFPLNDSIAQQTITLPGGFAPAGKMYLCYSTAPSAGSVLIEGLRPDGATWKAIYSGAAAGASSAFDGGYIVLRITFTGLTGAANPVLNVLEHSAAHPPSDLLTDGGFGPNRRLRVDTGQTGFFAGRMFRMFREFSIAAGATEIIRFECTKNFILWQQRVDIDAGGLKVENITAATPSGTWATGIPKTARNRMTEVPAPVTSGMTITIGGTITAPTVVDVIRVRAAVNQGNQSSSNVGESQSDERGFPPGTYYLRLSALTGVTETTTGVLRMSWEERE